MGSVDPGSPHEQRLLSAVVFTDVVGFSRMSANNESRAYQSLQRDFDVMTNLCRVHNGQVLNTMGDGMLMSFSSAVDAMSCALEIQRALANQNRTLPLSEVLHHRIGVHLGDIIVSGDNVFGDGVNTASRLQTHARPDSIWFSDTVHKVVNNKLKFESKYIGPRTFKNLGHTVSVWEVPPLAELIAQQQAEATGISPTLIIDSQEGEGVKGGRAALLVVASLLLVGIVVVGVFAARANFSVPERPAKPPVVATTANGDDLPVTPPVGNGESPPSTNGFHPPKPPDSEIAGQLASMRDRYDFAGIVTLLTGSGSEFPNASALATTYGSLSHLKEWMLDALASADPSNPIRLTSLNLSLFTNAGRLQADESGTGFRDFTVESLTPAQFLELAHSIRDRQAGQTPQDFSAWIQAFSQEYPGIP